MRKYLSPGEIDRAAEAIAGSIWGDRDRQGSQADQLRAAAYPNLGTDGDLTDSDREGLLALVQRIAPLGWR